MFEKYINTARALRGFDEQEYLASKTAILNLFFEREGLNAAVLGLSGGVDSALVYKLLLHAKAQLGSPIKRLHFVLAPIIDADGVTNQRDSVERVISMMRADQINNTQLHPDQTFTYQIVDLSETYKSMIYANNKYSKFHIHGDAWARGQMASVLRTPVFYYQAALLQFEGYKSLVVGTTNRDEGSYIGFFGKASDAMVDLQPIADIHKSEVYKVAKLLGVPDEIMSAAPAGDVWNGELDEETIGAPYDFLEAYLMEKQYPFNVNHTDEELKLYKQYSDRIEAIHGKNKHKYLVGSPARFIDIMPRTGIPGGW